MKTPGRKSVWLFRNKFYHAVLVAIVVAVISFPALLAIVEGFQFEIGIKKQLSESARLTLYLKGGTKDVKELLHRIEAVHGTVKVTQQSGTEAYDEFRSVLGNDAKAVLKGVTPEVFPSTIKVTVTYEALVDIHSYEKLLKSLIPEIETVLYPASYLQETLPSLHSYITIVKHSVRIVLCLAVIGIICLLIIAGWTNARSWRHVRYMLPISAGIGGMSSVFMLYLFQKNITQIVSTEPVLWWGWIFGLIGLVVLSIGVQGLQILLVRLLARSAYLNCQLIEHIRGDDNVHTMAAYPSTTDGNGTFQVTGRGDEPTGTVATGSQGNCGKTATAISDHFQGKGESSEDHCK